jgi:hypothetical protein
MGVPRHTVPTPTQATPYSLVYGCEAVLPLEVQLPSLRVALRDGLTQDEQIRLRFQELDSLEEERLHTVQNLELYRQNMARAYDKLVKRRVFRRGELVLVLQRPIVVTHKTKGKFEPKWEGPYVIEQVYDGGAYQLVDQQGARPMPPINGRFLKKILCISFFLPQVWSVCILHCTTRPPLFFCLCFFLSLSLPKLDLTCPKKKKTNGSPHGMFSCSAG